jgi:hypothetical protein
MGMHEGHAVEGVIYALCSALCAEREGFRVTHEHKELPLTMKTDVLVFNKSALHANIMVCHSDNSDYAHRKIKRTRQEFIEALQLAQTSIVTPDYRVINLVFGMPSGWQKNQISYMKSELRPTLFLPDLLDHRNYEDFMQWTLNAYRKAKSQKNSWRRIVTTHFLSGSAQIPAKHIVCDCLRDLLFSDAGQNCSPKGKQRKAAQHRPTSCELPKAFNTRYRQGLSMINVFPVSEIKCIYEAIKRGHIQLSELNGSSRAALARALWLGVVNISEDITSTLWIEPRKMQSVDKFDFSEPFKSLTLEQIEAIVELLDEHADLSPSAYAGGVQCLAMGSYQFVSERVHALAVGLVNYLECTTDTAAGVVRELLASDQPLLPEPSQNRAGNEGFKVGRSFVAALLSVVHGDPKLGGKHGFGFSSPNNMDAILIRDALTIMCREREKCLSELKAVIGMMEVFASRDVSKMVAWSLCACRPRTFAIEVPGSWLQRFYFVAVSHAAYNPLMSILFNSIVTKRHAIDTLFGFPKKLAQAVSELVNNKQAPGKFRIIAKTTPTELHIYEALSITENNIGNKAKELFDRIGAVKSWGLENGYTFVIHGAFDGDFSSATIEEFTGPGRYDEFIAFSDLCRIAAVGALSTAPEAIAQQGNMPAYPSNQSEPADAPSTGAREDGFLHPHNAASLRATDTKRISNPGDEDLAMAAENDAPQKLTKRRKSSGR